MRKLWVVLAVMALALVLVAPASAEFRWGNHNIGTNPLVPFPIENEQLLVQGLTMCQPQIGRGLSGRVPGDPYLAAVNLKKAVAAGQVQRAALPPGTRFPYMISNGGVNTNVIWIGPGQLEGFVVGEFFIPRQCGNLVPLPPQPRTPAPPQIVAPPPPPPVYAPPPMAAPPPPQPPAPVYQAEAGLGLGLGMSSWCGGGNTTIRNSTKVTEINNTNVYAPTTTDARKWVMGNGNTRDSGNMTSNQQSWSNRQNWVSNQQPAQPPCPQPRPQPQQQYCGPGQPAGRSGNSGSGYYYTNAGNPGAGFAPFPNGTSPAQPVMTRAPANNNQGTPANGNFGAFPGASSGTSPAQPVMAGRNGNSGTPANGGFGTPAGGSFGTPANGNFGAFPGASSGTSPAQPVMAGRNGNSGTPAGGSFGAFPGGRR